MSEEWLAAVDVARGGLPRGTWVKGAVEKALSSGVQVPVSDGVQSRASAASSRSSRVGQGDGRQGRGSGPLEGRDSGVTVRPPAESKRRVERVQGEGTPLPKIAPRRW